MHQKIYIILFLKASYMFRPCWAIFRENTIDTLHPPFERCRIRDTSQTEDEAQGTFALNYTNATIVMNIILPEDGPAGSKHVGDFQE
jgi:hypothetical protein